MKRYAPYIVLLLLVLVSSCGRKGPPTLKMYEPPKGPSELTAVHREGRIYLNWQAPRLSDGDIPLKGFSILRSEGEGGLKELAFTGDTAYVDESFETERSYTYKVAARSIKDVLSDGPDTAELTPRVVPEPPGDISFKVGVDSLSIVWSRPEGEPGVLFNVYKSEEPGSYGMLPINEKPIDGDAFTTEINPDSVLYYTVRALLGGPARHEGPASEEVSVGPDAFVPTAPKGLRVIQADGDAVLVWKGNQEAWGRGYRVMRGVDGGAMVYIGFSETPSFTDTGPPAGRIISYSVTAVGPSRWGPPSRAVEFNR